MTGGDRLQRALCAITGVPSTPGNRLELLRNGDQIFPAMIDEIRRSERSVDMLTFVYWEGEIGTQFGEALAERAAAGVRVRVLLDALGAKSIDRTLVDRMREAGADVRFFRPIDLRRPLRANHRTHRKVMVCDELVGFTGGVGIADEWRGDGRTGWRDTHVRLTGPAVDGLRAAFLDNWVETEQAIFDDVDRFPEHGSPGDTTVQVITGTAEPGWNAISMSVRALVDLAHDRVRITTAYFVPDDDFVERLVAATQRGVDVQILLPGPDADKRFVQLASEARYRELLDGGIRVWNYVPSMLHAKVMTVDGTLAVLGSANCNQRSTSLDDEVDVIVFDRQVAADLDDDFDADLDHSVAIDPARWRRRRLPQRLFETVMHQIRPWM